MIADDYPDQDDADGVGLELSRGVLAEVGGEEKVQRTNEAAESDADDADDYPDQDDADGVCLELSIHAEVELVEKVQRTNEAAESESLRARRLLHPSTRADFTLDGGFNYLRGQR